MQMRIGRCVSCAVFLFAATVAAGAGGLSVEFAGTAAFGTTAMDQNGQIFTVTGVSGITWLGGNEFVAVMDNSSRLIYLQIETGDNGAIQSCVIDRGFTLAESRDFEGIAPGLDAMSVFLSAEGGPDVCEYDTQTGMLIRSLPVPAHFASRRSNRGFESLTRHVSGEELWTANEEALTIDGPASSQSTGSLVRLLRFAAVAGEFIPQEQFAYLCEPLHGSPISNSRSGLVDLVQLPDRRLLALERSFALSESGFFRNRIFEINRAGATDVREFTGGLIGQSFTTAVKTQLWSGNVNNLEGLTLARWLPSGRRSLIGIVDDGDPISTNRVVAFVLFGSLIGGDMNCDGTVNNFDIDPFVLALTNPADYADSQPLCTREAADVNGDGAIDNFDIDGFVTLLIGQ